MWNWLPYRIRDYWSQRQIDAATRQITTTNPIKLSNEYADLEIHMVVCERDRYLTLIALKSLL
jgi:hypothetical protein